MTEIARMTERARKADSEAEPIALRAPVDVRSVSLSILAGAAVIMLLRYMQEVFIPLVLGGLLFYALDPFVDWL